MAIFRQYIAPFIVVLIFLTALVAVSARIFLPSDMAAPAPIEENRQISRWENGGLGFPVELGTVGKINSSLSSLSSLSHSLSV
ncbi:hypothetical protein SAMD00079811_07040 [Scytonema sp. HK-05]|uniref:hypothetical protein n=1 Tax=Scytonema sp. HK-05 TaxID=1137095 RepID=UPI0009366475|nr:hypothetical protein [Scytonema sp. HK-05]OKH59805.1 hypothetical protein NIES2130_06450 [Scytonema sp. HK-05]BAY43125.1 hypothetical protein SAMD00079811_07040 [Scytonema sp. HK-05]